MWLLKGIRFHLAIAIVIFPTLSWSGTNPIDYTLLPASGFPANPTVGSSYAVRYTFVNNLPFVEMIKSITLSRTSAGFTVVDNCTGRSLSANGGTCTVHVRFHPVSTAAANVRLSIRYDNNVVPMPRLSTTPQSGATTEISGVVSQVLPAGTEVGTGYPVEFTFTNVGSTDVTASSISYTGNTGNLSSIVNGCSSLLKPNLSCTITGTYTPSAAGEQSIGATYLYASSTKSVALSTSTLSHNGSGGCASVSGQGPLLLPINTYQYADNLVKFKFTNHCDSASAVLGTVSITGTLNDSAVPSSWILKGSTTDGYDTCSGQTLAANASCEVLASIVPQSTGNNFYIDASVNYTESSKTNTAAASTASNAVLANNNSDRMVTFINQCTVPVWATFYAGAVPTASGYNCAVSGCQAGSVCASNGSCYFNNPTLDSAHPKGLLAAAVANQAPDTMNITISENVSGTSPLRQVLYNGQIAARLGCVNTTPSGSNTNNLSCIVNNCGGLPAAANTTATDGQCTPSTGAPSSGGGFSFNVGEITLIRSSANNTIDGVYDTSTINGVTVPMELKGRGPYTTSTVRTAPYNNCNSTGSPIQQSGNSLGSCKYNYTTPSTTPTGSSAVPSSYRYVNASTPTVDCSSDETICTGTDVCGLFYDPTANKIFKRCGQLEGYAALFEGICTTNTLDSSISSLATDYKCNTTLGTNTGKELYGCSGSNGAATSCYGVPQSNNTCGGCVNWWEAAGGSLPVPTSTLLCNTSIKPTAGYNSNWYDLVEPQIQWVKTACPTAYAYQFDDPSSSYTCTVVNSTNNTIVTNYQVIFCPGGKEVSKIKPPSS